jgi:hypothetical protein
MKINEDEGRWRKMSKERRRMGGKGECRKMP